MRQAEREREKGILDREPDKIYQKEEGGGGGRRVDMQRKRYFLG